MQAVLNVTVPTDYEAEIHAWNWAGLKADAKLNVQESEEYGNEGEWYGRTFLGTVFAIMPSGKYYTPFANSNVDQNEADADEAFMEALENVANEHAMWIEHGEGDPCDMFLCCHCYPPASD